MTKVDDFVALARQFGEEIVALRAERDLFKRLAENKDCALMAAAKEVERLTIELEALKSPPTQEPSEKA